MSATIGISGPSGAAVHLRPLHETDERAVRAAHADMTRDDGFDFALGLTPTMSWPEYLAALEECRHGVNLPTGIVPATFLVATVNEAIVGRASIRHTLNESLRRRGGHIGYAVLAEYRCRGYGTQILRRSILMAERLGIGEILISCDETNVGSRRIIERCGGLFDSAESWPDGNRIRRYWIK